VLNSVNKIILAKNLKNSIIETEINNLNKEKIIEPKRISTAKKEKTP